MACTRSAVTNLLALLLSHLRDSSADFSVLLAREANFPATIADLYDPDEMPANLRAAHDRNDETLERIYLGRRFKKDTERFETLFSLYTQITTKGTTAPAKPAPRRKKLDAA